MLIYDYFAPTPDNIQYGTDPHGEKVSYVSQQASHSDQVEFYHVQLSASATDWASSLSAIADYDSPPEVLNMSLALNPAVLFQENFDLFEVDFEATHGSDHSLWSVATQAAYKAEVQALLDRTVQSFRDIYGLLPQELKTALEKLVSRGTTVVVSAGNDGEVQQILDDLGITAPDLFFEGCYLPDVPQGVVVVGASIGNDVTSPPAYFTTPAATIDVAADGFDVQVSADGDVSEGTSFSAPQITALVADMKALDPDLTPAQIENILAESATPQEGEEIRLGAGVVDPQKALDLVKQRLELQPILSTVQGNFHAFSSAGSGSFTDEWIDNQDLRALVTSTFATEEMRAAAQYLLDHPDVFTAWESAERGKADGRLGMEDLSVWAAEKRSSGDPDFVAVQQLKAHFSQVDAMVEGKAYGWFNKNDLFALMNDTTAAPKLRSAAEYLYDNPALFTALDGAYSTVFDGSISYPDLTNWQASHAV